MSQKNNAKSNSQIQTSLNVFMYMHIQFAHTYLSTYKRQVLQRFKDSSRARSPCSPTGVHQKFKTRRWPWARRRRRGRSRRRRACEARPRARCPRRARAGPARSCASAAAAHAGTPPRATATSVAALAAARRRASSSCCSLRRHRCHRASPPPSSSSGRSPAHPVRLPPPSAATMPGGTAWLV